MPSPTQLQGSAWMTLNRRTQSKREEKGKNDDGEENANRWSNEQEQRSSPSEKTDEHLFAHSVFLQIGMIHKGKGDHSLQDGPPYCLSFPTSSISTS